MADPKWTPGPWRKMQGKYTDTYVIVAGDYANEGQPDMWAEVVTPNEMDASLIAAAPDLYEALECLLDADKCDACIEQVCMGDEDCPCDGKCHAEVGAARRKARRALRKARGEDA